MQAFHYIWKVFLREWRILIMHPIYPLCMVVLPIFVTGFFTTLMDEGQPQEMPVGVVDMDNTATTRKLTRMLDSFQSSKVVAHYPTMDDARLAIQRGEIYSFLYFPAHTTDDMLSARQPKVSFYYSSVHYTAGTLTYKDLKTVTTLAAAGVAQGTLQAKGFTSQQIKTIIQPIAVEAHTTNNPWINYNYFLSSMFVPGCILLFIFLLTAFSFGAELKFSTNRQLMATANGNTIIAVIGKLLPQTIVFVAVMYATMYYMYGVLHFPCAGGWGRVMLLGFLSVIATQGFGLLVFSLMPSTRMSMSICSLWGVLSFSLVGGAFPVFAMDKMLEAVSCLFPLRHYYVIYHTCILNDFPLSEVSTNIILLLVFAFSPLVLTKRLGHALRHYIYIP